MLDTAPFALWMCLKSHIQVPYKWKAVQRWSSLQSSCRPFCSFWLFTLRVWTILEICWFVHAWSKLENDSKFGCILAIETFSWIRMNENSSSWCQTRKWIMEQGYLFPVISCCYLHNSSVSRKLLRLQRTVLTVTTLMSCWGWTQLNLFHTQD